MADRKPKPCKCLEKALVLIKEKYGQTAEADLGLSLGPDGQWYTRPFAVRFTYVERRKKKTGYVAATHCSMCGAPYVRSTPKKKAVRRG